MRIPRHPRMHFRKFVQPFQPPPTHKIDASGRLVPLGVPIPKMPGEAPRPALPAHAAGGPPAASVPRTSTATVAPPPPSSAPPRESRIGHALAHVDPSDRAVLLDLNARLVRAAPDLPPLLSIEQADRLGAARCSPAESHEPDESASSRPSNSNRSRATRRKGRRQNPGRRRASGRRTAGRRGGANATNAPSADHHERHCSICEHPERDEIEAEFVEWFYPGQIAHRHDVERRALYRHAHATGLYARRDANLRFALAALIECCHEAEVSGDTVVRAVRAYTRVNSEGQWIEPPTRVTVSPGGAFLSGESLTRVVPLMGPAMESAIELLPGAGDDSPHAAIDSSSEWADGESDGRARK